MDNLNLLYCDTFDRFVSCFDSDFSKLDNGFISLMDIMTRKRLNSYEQRIQDEIKEKAGIFVDRVVLFDEKMASYYAPELLEIMRDYHTKKIKSDTYRIDYRDKKGAFITLYIKSKQAEERIALFSKFLTNKTLDLEYKTIAQYERTKLKLLTK